MFWTHYLIIDEVHEQLSLELVCDNSPLAHYISLVDVKSHKKEDGLRFAKFLDMVTLVNKLLKVLGFLTCDDNSMVCRATY